MQSEKLAGDVASDTHNYYAIICIHIKDLVFQFFEKQIKLNFQNKYLFQIFYKYVVFT